MQAFESTLLEWLVEDGGQVVEGQPLYLLETNKAETEVEAGASGTLRRMAEVSDEPLPVGFQIAVIEP
jgi:pyruvate/2-oxoglutarate dehydrogenase complex dihydrolipoamide acyltransferase (E2) component